MATAADDPADSDAHGAKAIAVGWLKEQWRFWRRLLARLGLLGLVALALGLLLMLWGAAHERHMTLWQAVLQSEIWWHVGEEAGIAMIVAAIAVVGYELLQHTPHIKELHDDLNEQIRELSKLRVAVSRAVETPLQGVARHLDTLFPGPDNQALRDALMRFLQHTHQIASHGKRQTDATHGRESVEYVKYLGWLMEQFAADSSSKLLQFIDAINEERTGVSYDYAPPDRRDVARRILAAQMRCMGEGERYASIANLSIYDMPDAAFIDATRGALQRGLQIERIFNLIPFEDELARDRRLFLRFKRIVQAQRALGGRYEIAFLGSAALPCLDRALLRAMNLRPDTESFEALFFGLFTHHGGDTLLFDAPSTDVSNLVLTYCGNDRAAWSANSRANLFQHLWQLCRTAPDPFADDRFDPHWMDDCCGRLAA
jgi:hypothetical protein